LIEIINKPLLLHLVGYLYNWQMGFNSVFKGLNWIYYRWTTPHVKTAQVLRSLENSNRAMSARSLKRKAARSTVNNSKPSHHVLLAFQDT